MKIAVIGYGKMGRKIKEIAQHRKHQVVTIDPTATDADFKDILSLPSNIDCAVDFSSPEAVLKNIKTVSEKNIPLVIGTTGWYEHLEQLKTDTIAHNRKILWGANFSIGMNLFMKLTEESARLFSKFKQYECSGFEIHHSQKKDSPSGTALVLSELMGKHLERKPVFSGVRVGAEPGTHTVIFDSTVDTIEFTHRARSRDGFADGAVMAAEWLFESQPGFYSFTECFNEGKK